jgi:hypothetical protein
MTFITSLERVYCAVQTEPLNTILAMVQVPSCRPVTARARVQSLVCQCEFCRGHSGTGTDDHLSST